jgi:hypothetical protein
MYWIGYVLALLATIVVGWALPIVGVAILLPLLQVVYTLQPLIAAGLMIFLGGLLVWYSATRQAWWQAVVWGALWGMGALTAGLEVFHWYALILESVLMIIAFSASAFVPGRRGQSFRNFLRWYAAGEIGLLAFLWGQGVGLSGATLVLALLLLAFAFLVGHGAYLPNQRRLIQRRLAGLATAAAVLLSLWQPVIRPAGQWLGQAATLAWQATSEAVSTSPIGRWYRILALQTERRELGEASKTEALRQLQPTLAEAHKARWERGISQIPNLPLAQREWGDLGVPPEADP